MAEQAPSSVLVLMAATSLASLVALFFLFQKHIDGQPLLSYQPRRRVPWGPLVALFAMAMPLVGVATVLISTSELTPELEPATPDSPVVADWGSFAFMVLFVFVVAAWIVAFYRADARDLGLPTSFGEALRDILVGCFATIAAFFPVYVVQLTLLGIVGSETKHPLVQQLEENHSPEMLALGFAMAVIAAPLFEEFTFRCLLQGWLERREDEVLGYLPTQRLPTEEELAQLSDGETSVSVATAEIQSIEALPSDETTTVQVAPIDDNQRPERGWLLGLPHGWTPILISGVAFGLAHVGHGVAPVSLVLFGIVLGYLYQRTHRLLPSITAHLVFNAYSMLLLWLQLDTAT